VAREEAPDERAAVDPARQKIKYFWAVFNSASALRTQGRFREAAEAYRKCLELNPRHEDSLYYLGTSLYEQGEYAESLAALRKLTEANPESGRGWAQLANTLSTLAPGAPQDFEAARQAYQRNIEVNKEQAGPFLRLGTLDLNQGKLSEALTRFRLAVASGAPEAGYLMAYTLFLQGKDHDAIPFLRKILDAYGRGKKITGKGVLSEGDLIPAPGKPLTALERAALKSILLLYWISVRSDGHPAGIAAEFHLQPLPAAARRSEGFAATPSGGNSAAAPGGKRSVAVDFDADGQPERIEINPAVEGRDSLRYFHKTGDGWADRTEDAGLAGDGTAVDCAVGDYDRDGKPDLLVLYWKKGARLYRNLGGGRFSDVTAASGLGEAAGDRYSALFFDYDRDGWLDVLLTAHAPYEDAVRCLLEPHLRFARHTPLLFHNRGNGTFEDVTKAVGLDRCYGTMQVAVADFDGDGWPDLAFANGSLDAERLEPSVILHNEGGKRFSEWSYLPGFSAPSNAVGLVVTEPKGGRRPAVRLIPNPILCRARAAF
jgi:Flp pilus assembly protein TadD